ncbi:MAG TPA: RNA polymerase sigma factor, partial [Chryseosolibacter sp.]|nr:RNA polymerase sigma factor [Chryseosolibacter sp.]
TTDVIIFPYLRHITTRPPPVIGDEKKFIDLINEHQGLIHKVCIMYESDRDIRNDLFQEIVLQLWRSFPTFRGESKITTWMYRIALNTAISGYRKQTRNVRTEDLSDFHFNISDQATDDAEENIQRLHLAIRRLSEIERAMIMMALEEVPYDEIAETIGITQNNVRVRMNRIREKLRKLMSAQHGN